MIKVIGGDLHQWDNNRAVSLENVDFDEVHFCNAILSEAIVTKPETETAYIPNELLQMPCALLVYAVKNDSVIENEIFDVKARAKPADYETITTPEVEAIIDNSGLVEGDNVIEKTKKLINNTINAAALVGGGNADIVTRINTANALGVQNLVSKGVLTVRNPTTYEIMEKIAEINSDNISDTNPPIYGDIETLETLIDESGVLDSTEGSVEDKVEQLIDKAEELNTFMNITNAQQLFCGAKSFPTKAVVNLPNTTNINSAFADWTADSIPMVEEVILNAPNIDNSASTNTTSVFSQNRCVQRVVLNLSNETKYLNKVFTNTYVEEIVLGFSTKNVEDYNYCFRYCTALKNIIGALDFSSATSDTNAFQNCTELEEVRFEPNTLSLSISLAQSSKLTAESLQSIIDGLATVETAQTLTLSSTVFDKLTDEQLATIAAKNWLVA